jgi:hypothetical protein
MTTKVRSGDPKSINVILYYMIEKTDLENLSDAAWAAYRDALALLDREFTVEEETAAVKKLLSTGWKTEEGLTVRNWKKFVPQDF